MLPVSCYCTRARRGARALTALYDDALAPSGLKVTQYSLLRAIGRLEAPSITKLAAATGLDRSTLGRNLRPLERSALITLRPGRDERSRVATLSAAGKDALAAAAPLWAQAQAQVESRLDAGDQALLSLALERLERLLPATTR